MTCWSWLAALSFLLQVPPPTPGTEAAQQLEANRRSIIAREAAELSTLAEGLARQGTTEEAGVIRSMRARPLERDGPTRFMPLPEVVERSRSTKPPPPGAREIRDRAAQALFNLAGQAAEAERIVVAEEGLSETVRALEHAARRQHTASVANAIVVCILLARIC